MSLFSHNLVAKFINLVAFHMKLEKTSILYVNNDVICHLEILGRSAVGWSGVDRNQYASLKKE